MRFRNWLEWEGLHVDPDFADEQNRKVSQSDKTGNCTIQKLNSCGIKAKFELLNRKNLRKRVEPAPDAITVIKTDADLPGVMTCWMILHQVGHAMEKDRDASAMYREIDAMIQKWWILYHQTLMGESLAPEDGDYIPEPIQQNYTVQSPQPQKIIRKPKIQDVNFSDPEHRNWYRQQANAPQFGGYIPNFAEKRGMAHAFFSKFLAFKSARDTWNDVRSSFHSGNAYRDSLMAYKSSKGSFTGEDELLNELVAEYLWHGKKIRFVNDPNDPFLQKNPEYMKQMFSQMEGLIQKGLEMMIGKVIRVG